MAALVGLIVLQESLHWSQWIAVLCVVAASSGVTGGAGLDVYPRPRPPRSRSFSLLVITSSTTSRAGAPAAWGLGQRAVPDTAGDGRCSRLRRQDRAGPLRG